MIAPALLVAWLAQLAPAAAVQAPRPAAPASRPAAGPPSAEGEVREEVELVGVESGDTFRVRRAGAVERVHLLSVDAEEPIAGRDASSMTKPQTPFGDECVRWVQALLRARAGPDGTTHLTLVFPAGVARRDVYGRLLAHVLLDGDGGDGEDLNLRLVREGKSPYYNKYGNSLVCHDAFVAAQEEARAKGLGIWDPKTNSGDVRGAPAEKRPYPELIAWWNARAAAIDAFRARVAQEPGSVLAAEDADGLARAAGEPGREVLVFGEIARVVPRGGGRDFVFRALDRSRELVARVPAERLAAYAPLQLETRVGTFRQNFLYVRGTLARTEDGTLVLVSDGPERWRLAGPEPELPE
jgi:endonuclease YncB( thermonuclease family)